MTENPDITHETERRARLTWSLLAEPSDAVALMARERLGSRAALELAREATPTERGYTSYKVGVGHSHGARPPGIVGAMTGEGGLHGKDIGKIQIFPHFSLVQIRGSLSPEQMDRISRAKLGGRELRIGPDRGPRGGKGPRRDGERPFRRDDRPRRDDREEWMTHSDSISLGMSARASSRAASATVRNLFSY